tara:strand:- start:1902 stop:3500 length:1599 start_codon:yes stop_codon:yes gene_type:complete
MSRPFHASELVESEPIWLLVLEYAGREFRFATEGIVIESSGGVFKPFEGTLSSIDIEEAFEFLSENADFPSVSIEVVFPVDVAELIEKGHDLAAASGELSLILDGNQYETRRVFLRGEVSQPTYGAEGEPVRFSLERLPLNDAALFPPSGLVASSSALSAAPESSIGKTYPWVFGEVGATVDEAGVTVKAYATPGFQVGTFVAPGPVTRRKILIAGHRVSAQTVNIYNSDADQNMAGETVYHDTDAHGQEYAYTAFAQSPGTSDKDKYSIDWSGSGGSYPNLHHDGPLERGGDLLRFMFSQSSLEVDQGRTVAAAALLQSYRFGGFINKPVAPLKWLQEHLIPLLPVSIAVGGDGIYPIVWRFDATPEHAVESITAGPHFERQGPITYEGDDVKNEIRLRYGFSAWRDDFTRSITISGNPDSDDPDQISNVFTRASFTRYGTQATEIESVIVYDPATAAAIVKWQSRAFAFRRRVISYTADYRFGWLERGDVVTITDSEMHLQDRCALVQSITWGASSLSIKLLIIDDPPRD